MRAEQVTIRDGSVVALRPIGPGDKAALVRGFERLSPQSRYRRFFAPLSRLSETDLRYLTEVDHSDHEALIALEPDSGETVGVARFVRSEDPAAAEVAVTVVDDWQGRGVATALLERLISRARDEGIERFTAVVLEENAAVIELFKQISGGEASSTRNADGHRELVFELGDEREEVGGTLLGRALRFAARGDVVINPWRLLRRRVHETAEHGLERPEEE